MAVPRVTFIYELMLVMLLLKLTLAFASSDAINQLDHPNGFTVAERVDDIANTEAHDALKDQYAKHAPLDLDDGVTAPQEPDTTIAEAYAKLKSNPMSSLGLASPTMIVKRYTFSVVTSALSVASFTPVRSTTAKAKTVNRKPTTTALPCVTTLATYGMSGEPSLKWTLTAAVCPTTLATIAKNK